MKRNDSFKRRDILAIVAVLLIPLVDQILPSSLQLSDSFRTIFIFALMGLGLNIVTGYTGLLNLGSAAFMAIGAYSFAILTCAIYPFQLDFWGGILGALIAGGLAGWILGLPTIRLKGDYLAIVTLGFGEIIQDLLRNLDVITKGTQGINPLPSPTLFGIAITSHNRLFSYYLFLLLLAVMAWGVWNLSRSRTGRMWLAIREDELAAGTMGVKVVGRKLSACAIGASLCSLAGALSASYFSSTGEPGNFDFNISIITLCIVIVGGLGSIRGVFVGAVVMIGLNTIVLSKLASILNAFGLSSTTNVFSSPTNWKYMIFGLALILVMRFRPEGITGAPQKRTGGLK